MWLWVFKDAEEGGGFSSHDCEIAVQVAGSNVFAGFKCSRGTRGEVRCENMVQHGHTICAGGTLLSH
jgi:hypothetical protein